MPKNKTLNWIASLLIVIGALNWGLVTWFDFNLVDFISFGVSGVAYTIYSLVAVSAIYSLYRMFVK